MHSPLFYIQAVLKCNKTLWIKVSHYCNEWPLEMSSRLNPIGTGGKCCHKIVPMEKVSVTVTDSNITLFFFYLWLPSSQDNIKAVMYFSEDDLYIVQRLFPLGAKPFFKFYP